MTTGGSHDGATRIGLRPATAADWPVLRQWIARPDVQRWWGSPSAVEAEIRIVSETQSAIARIVEAGSTTIGYAHAIDAMHWGSDLPDGMPPGTWDVDLVIAEMGYRGQGFGRMALDALADEVFSTTLALALSVVVPVTNEAAVRAYEHAGFTWRAVWEDSQCGPSWLLVRDRPTSQRF